MLAVRVRLERAPLTTAVLYTVVGVVPLYLVAAQAVAIQRALEFGPRELGLIVSTYFLVSSVASKRVGPRLDRVGARRGLRLAMALTVVACLAVTLVAHRWQVLAALIGVSGLANAYGQVGSNLVVAHLVGAGRQGIAFSAKQAAIPLSAVLSGLVVPVLGEVTSWRWPFAAVVLVAALLWLLCPELDHTARPAEETAGEQRHRPRTTPALMALMLAATVGGGTGNAVASFAVDASVASGLSAASGALLLTAGSLVAIVVRLLSGTSVDRGGGTGRRHIAVLFLVGAIGLGMLAGAGGSPGWFVAGLLLTFAGAWGWQGVVTYLVVRTIDLPAATSTGAVWAGIYLGTVVVPAITGVVAERTSYAVVFTGMSAAMLAALGALGLSVLLGRR